jgi:hypothetical protein
MVCGRELGTCSLGRGFQTEETGSIEDMGIDRFFVIQSIILIDKWASIILGRCGAIWPKKVKNRWGSPGKAVDRVSLVNMVIANNQRRAEEKHGQLPRQQGWYIRP